MRMKSVMSADNQRLYVGDAIWFADVNLNGEHKVFSSKIEEILKSGQVVYDRGEPWGLMRAPRGSFFSNEEGANDFLDQLKREEEAFLDEWNDE